MENQIFSTRRFALYMRKFIVENRNSLAINTAILVMLPILYCCFIPLLTQCYAGLPNKYTAMCDPMWNKEVGFFTILWLASACGFGSIFYDKLKKKTTRTSFLTIPVSTLEKFTTFFLIYILFYSVIIIVALFLADAMRVLIYAGEATPGIKVALISPKTLFTLGHDLPAIIAQTDSMPLSDQAMIEMGAFYSALILAQSFFAMGSSVWPKNSLLKSGCFLMAFNMLSGYLMYLGYKTFYGCRVIQREWLEDLTATQTSVWMICISFVLALFMWWISYRRMKEWEIIQRW